MRGNSYYLRLGLAGLLVIISFTLARCGVKENADIFMKCFSGEKCLSKPTIWEHLTEDWPSCLVAARVWWSEHPSTIPVTLVTQLSAERLDQLRAQCATWDGPLAAALYLPLLNPSTVQLADANRQKIQVMIAAADDLFRQSEQRHAGQRQQELKRIADRRTAIIKDIQEPSRRHLLQNSGSIMTINTTKPQQTISANSGSTHILTDSTTTTNHTAGGCQLRLVLLYELFADPRALVLYPVNTLRNYARLLADTDLITNIDVDMIPSISISAALAHPHTLAQYHEGCRRGGVYVWPAFETHCGGRGYADAVAVGGKALVPTALRKCLRRMRPKAPFSHNATDYERWMKSNEMYGITYSLQYEPWFLSWRWGTLWYDYRYRGYGKNKIVQAAATNASGASWFVSPHGFLVHRPHTASRARREFLAAKFSHKDMAALTGSLYQHVEATWAKTVEELTAGRYRAHVERSFQECMDSLPWWRQEGGGRGVGG